MNRAEGEVVHCEDELRLVSEHVDGGELVEWRKWRVLRPLVWDGGGRENNVISIYLLLGYSCGATGGMC